MTVHMGDWSRSKVTHAGEMFIQSLQIRQGGIAGEGGKVLFKPLSAARSFRKAGGI